MFLTDLAGSLYSAKLDGPRRKPLLMGQGNLIGVAYAELTTRETDHVLHSPFVGSPSSDRARSWAAQYLRGDRRHRNRPAPQAEPNLRKVRRRGVARPHRMASRRRGSEASSVHASMKERSRAPISFRRTVRSAGLR